MRKTGAYPNIGSHQRRTTACTVRYSREPILKLRVSWMTTAMYGEKCYCNDYLYKHLVVVRS